MRDLKLSMLETGKLRSNYSLSLSLKNSFKKNYFQGIKSSK